ncbi:MAG: hypothetical protein ABI743_14600, partial [bacterium]
MAIPAQAWAFGLYDERDPAGGLPGLIYADTVFPYTVSPTQIPPFVPDFPAGAIPTGPGQFQGFERNLTATGGKAPNFGNAVGFNMVLVHSNALAMSASAPPRRRDGSDVHDDLTSANFTLPNAAVNFFKYYKRAYLDSTSIPPTRMIPQVPEREVRHW